jgi:phosphatidylglycerol:prolipoprotein diacylglycerol transferase
MSMGQWLCVPMVVVGLWLWWWAPRQQVAKDSQVTEKGSL